MIRLYMMAADIFLQWETGHVEQRPGRIYRAPQETLWPETTPEDAAFDPVALENVAQYAADHGSNSLLVIRNGSLVLERYWNGKTSSDVQQTYSGTKSMFSLLVGRAIASGYIEGLDVPVRRLVPEMPASQEQLTFRNVMAMESGMVFSMKLEKGAQMAGKTHLETALEREVIGAPFERWHYNNTSYRLLHTALERASGMDLEALTEKEIFEPLSFDGAHWMRLYAVTDSGERFTGYQSVRMAPRDYAKPAQVIVADGMWEGEQFLPADYAHALIRCPAPEVNPSFGLCHHLNAGSFHYQNMDVPEKVNDQLVPGAPADLFWIMAGPAGVSAGIPSQKLVIVRTSSSGRREDNLIILKMVAEASES